MSASTGFRMTPQRSAILEVVKESNMHLTAGEIYERVRRKYPTIAYGTVYRTLHLFAERGVIQEFPFGDQASRFDGRTDRHDHVHCQACGGLYDVDVPIAILARQVAEEQTGFEIDGHQTVFQGVCPACQSRASKRNTR